MYDALFPGGARLRPRLVVEVARACGTPATAIVEAAAAAVEMVHCASLVHDDLPCFDDAAVRRGRPAVHRGHGEPLAVLVGDGLVVAAFETLARGFAGRPDRVGQAIEMLAAGLGPRTGLVAGQAWESEPHPDLGAYHRAKTAALFEAAARLGALAADAAPQAWAFLGRCLGEAFQIFDDLRDVTAPAEPLGKPIGRDAALGRPNAVLALGERGARERLRDLQRHLHEGIPDCPGRRAFRAWLVAECERLGGVRPLPASDSTGA